MQKANLNKLMKKMSNVLTCVWNDLVPFKQIDSKKKAKKPAKELKRKRISKAKGKVALSLQ